MKFRRKKLPAILFQEEIDKLVAIPNRRYLTGLRNLAILKIMLNCGLRVSEVVNLHPGDINLANRVVRIKEGKGGVDRDISLPENTIQILREWKEQKPKGDYFFPVIQSNSRAGSYKTKKGKKEITVTFNSKRGSKLSTRNIQFMIKNYSKRAGIKKNIYPHTLRHTFATNFYRQTKDIETLRKLLGHSDISTTQIYVTLANIDVEKAMSLFREIA